MQAFKKLLEETTKRPWRLLSDIHIVAGTEEQEWIAETFGEIPQLHANARLLILASNNVEELVKQLAKMTTLYQAVIGKRTGECIAAHELLAQIEKEAAE